MAMAMCDNVEQSKVSKSSGEVGVENGYDELVSFPQPLFDFLA